ncbi:galactosamine-6-phosphate isomerase [Arenibacter sp. TNZ]|uniref:galactosamine-6-phosphate isomerase n=1 Tax=Arenibacter TaxID=178469 RepID=UPI000CD4594A|nr:MULTISPECIES: galactosamine-6-phosphate isomerase [Arenibacter]MCM4171079.1 galactosamine-6-phosphate isomerase [Arenibacter sp. TNZ]
MNIHYCTDYENMSQMAFDSLLSLLKDKPEQLICTATGHSPTGLYEKLVKSHKRSPKVFKELKIIKLDEWGGTNGDYPNTCEHYLQKNLLEPLDIPKSNYISFDSSPTDAKKECDRMDNEIQEHGPIDICILGLGKNGHIGFNEPSKILYPDCHIADLSASSLKHPMANKMMTKPTYGLTLGMANILKSKKIILLVTGPNKKKAIKRLLNKEITTALPGSFLWLHPNVDCYLDRSSL